MNYSTFAANLPAPSQRWYSWLRVGWVLFALNSVWTFALTLYFTYQFSVNLPERVALGLQALGLTPQFYFWFNAIGILIYYLCFFAVAVLIFVLRPTDRMALFAAVFLMAFGTANAYIAAPEYLTFWVTAPVYYIVPYLLTNVLAWPLLAFFFAVFPDGRFVPRWIALIAAYTFVFGVLWGSNPQAFGSPEGWLTIFVTISVVAVFLSTLYAQVWRYRYHSTPLQRQQTKWLVFGLTVAAIITILNQFVTSFIFPTRTTDAGTSVLVELITVVTDLSFVLIPLSIGVAVLRYRLWDIDVLIRKTLTYGLVAALLASVYFGSVILLQRAFATLAGEQPEIITVISTLAIAVLFIPLRNWIQALIDRRFYRNKYDAQKVLQQFAESVRDETDLEKLTGSLAQVVNETMQPRGVSVWLQDAEQKK